MVTQSYKDLFNASQLPNLAGSFSTPEEMKKKRKPEKCGCT
jgi:hypothetical protein